MLQLLYTKRHGEHVMQILSLLGDLHVSFSNGLLGTDYSTKVCACTLTCIWVS